MILLDTHTLLWFLEDSSRLPENIKLVIEESDRVATSLISLWEIAIKVSIDKLELRIAFDDFPNALETLAIEILPLSWADIQHYVNLPLHHRDPFDRLLIAQAINQSLVLVSADSILDRYSVQRLWV
ncbi:type II toxin-antitoxin system VapC family toxin [Synechococcus elongatus]|uniref:Type II toxin-antitoxin system VapC family toxin n=1 Tax=Synechococcus elongatus PCC 11802 TaxID=2283154 RepID=A0AAT9JXW1_SYNEL|nr:type II toxin-antitoxin system VapC family toxin [Synechococcus elongatus]QFZ93062.1 type II toxin-antitoxin system VapC family toxin [Synechococcus elongatus PCC 11802]